jgi:hypothetical protein
MFSWISFLYFFISTWNGLGKTVTLWAEFCGKWFKFLNEFCAGKFQIINFFFILLWLIRETFRKPHTFRKIFESHKMLHKFLQKMKNSIHNNSHLMNQSAIKKPENNFPRNHPQYFMKMGRNSTPCG